MEGLIFGILRYSKVQALTIEAMTSSPNKAVNFNLKTKGLFLESPGSFSNPKNKCFISCRVVIQDQSFNNFENDTMTVKKAQLTGL